ncbi:YlaH-like family protein [Exiguobacterium flavidum]|uniref:YlaH-like family protein n=1 Tax=Exiguobacterium flavidum TaxID=2184695 RepID=UPI000DF76F39|nr:YlaH-like family protein [Exiguobacterium flavidum]
MNAKAAEALDLSKYDIPAIAKLVGVGSDPNNIEAGFVPLLITTVVLTLVVYKLGFAKELAWWKSLIVYLLLIVLSASLELAFWMMPIPEVLIAMVLILGIYRARMWMVRREREKTVS